MGRKGRTKGGGGWEGDRVGAGCPPSGSAPAAAWERRRAQRPPTDPVPAGEGGDGARRDSWLTGLGAVILIIVAAPVVLLLSVSASAATSKLLSPPPMGARQQAQQATADDCAAGWEGEDCLRCAPGHSGPHCTPDDCEPGWTGPDCLACAPGHAGDFCTRVSRGCAVGEQRTEGAGCASCLAGTFDHDRDPETPCQVPSHPPLSLACPRPPLWC